ncbi:MAG: RagB/SusD family nutrient uptake outer membrane protein [Bacteroidales bacterium]|nr:RagB/SusD family nutrient uptake outer membrane protein [Bacteroidales bacterium]
MKKIVYLSLISIAFLASSCVEDFLDRKNLYDKSDESYYRTPADIEEALTGAYAAVPIEAGNNNPIIVANLMSDDQFGGGGTNDDGFHGTDAFTLPPDQNYYMNLFETNWEGILRTNLILKRFHQAEYTDEDAKNQALGEAYILRAFFYLRLSQFYGPVPLKTEPEPANLPRATPEEMYGQIMQDLKTAIEVMPSTPYQSIPIARSGHVNKWVAEALAARAFLFYTGYYEKDDVQLPDGGTVTQSDVAGWLDDCIDNSGYRLLDDFRNNWAYSAVERYPYAAVNGLDWADDDAGGNPEILWGIKYSPFAGWSPPSQQMSYSNQNVLYSGLRQQEHVPFGQGWGAGPVNPQVWDSFEEGDVRREGSILNINVATVEEEGEIALVDDPATTEVVEGYIWGSDNQVHETGLWCKKYLPVYDSTALHSTGIGSIFLIEYGTPDNMQLWNMQDDIIVRFADVLLMAAELNMNTAKGDEYLNMVRNRAGLDDATSTLENIQLERRHELLGEGFRYFDLLRWGIVEEAFQTANNIPVKDVAVETTYTVTYRPETGGFLPIPKSEIDLSEGVLEQTPGWEDWL